MVITDRNTVTALPKKEPQKNMKRKSRPHGLPSPALCCACGLCIMLAGLNITLVGAFAFSTLVPSANPPIIIGPILLLLAFCFFGACCVCSRLPPPHSSQRSKVGRGAGLMGRGRLAGGATFEIETSEHTLQDTTAVQLSPTSSPGSSQVSSPEKEAPDEAPPGQCKLFTIMDSNGASSVSAGAVYSASAASGGEVRLNLPHEETVT